MNTPLRYLTHQVDGMLYGAWYRELDRSDELEVFGTGFYVSIAVTSGVTVEELVKLTVEEFVIARREQGQQLPTVSDLKAAAATSIGTAETAGLIPDRARADAQCSGMAPTAISVQQEAHRLAAFCLSTAKS